MEKKAPSGSATSHLTSVVTGNRTGGESRDSSAVGPADKRYYQAHFPGPVKGDHPVTGEGSESNDPPPDLGDTEWRCPDCGCQDIRHGNPDECPYDHAGEAACLDCERVACDCPCHEALEALSRVAITPAGRGALATDGRAWFRLVPQCTAIGGRSCVCFDREGACPHTDEAAAYVPTEEEERLVALRSPWAKVARLGGQVRARAANAAAEMRDEEKGSRWRAHLGGRSVAGQLEAGFLRALARELAGGGS